MRKEILFKIVVDDDKVASMIQKVGFKNDMSSKFEIMGILSKVLGDEQQKINNKLKEQNYNIKEILDTEEDAL